MRSTLAALAGLALLAASASLAACSSSDDGGGASGPSIVGAWEYASGATTINIDLRDDKSCAYALTAPSVQQCDKCTYTFEGGVLTISFPATGQRSSQKAELPDSKTLRIEGTGGVFQTYARKDFPAAIAGTCK